MINPIKITKSLQLKAKNKLRQIIVSSVCEFLFRDEMEKSIKMPMSGYLVHLRMILNRLPRCINQDCENCRSLIVSRRILEKEVDHLILQCATHYGINIDR